MTLPREEGRTGVIIILIILSGMYAIYVNCVTIGSWLGKTRNKFDFSLEYNVDILGRLGIIIAQSYVTINNIDRQHQTTVIPIAISQVFCIIVLCRRYRVRVSCRDKDSSTKMITTSILVRILFTLQALLLGAKLDGSIQTSSVFIMIPVWIMLTPLLGFSIALILTMPSYFFKEYRRRLENLGNRLFTSPGAARQLCHPHFSIVWSRRLLDCGGILPRRKSEL